MPDVFRICPPAHAVHGDAGGCGLVVGAAHEGAGTGVFAGFPVNPGAFVLPVPAHIDFESAYNIRVRQVQENILSISALAIVSLLLSVVIVAVGLGVIFGWLGYVMPVIVLLLFGALISATDPVAVLALFKEYGAPRRLMLFV